MATEDDNRSTHAPDVRQRVQELAQTTVPTSITNIPRNCLQSEKVLRSKDADQGTIGGGGTPQWWTDQ